MQEGAKGSYAINGPIVGKKTIGEKINNWISVILLFIEWMSVLLILNMSIS